MLNPTIYNLDLGVGIRHIYFLTVHVCRMLCKIVCRIVIGARIDVLTRVTIVLVSTSTATLTSLGEVCGLSYAVPGASTLGALHQLLSSRPLSSLSSSFLPCPTAPLLAAKHPPKPSYGDPGERCVISPGGESIFGTRNSVWWKRCWFFFQNIHHRDVC